MWRLRPALAAGGGVAALLGLSRTATTCDGTAATPSAGAAPATQTDVLIVGGGIIGSAAAYYAAKAGAKVTLLERGSIASEASSLSAGTL
jgi:NADPH-dependent 2,4-dienoyl-CoA reductase/sulfur reductase-like enzyme